MNYRICENENEYYKIQRLEEYNFFIIKRKLWDAYLDDYKNEIFDWSPRMMLKTFCYYCDDGIRGVNRMQAKLKFPMGTKCTLCNNKLELNKDGDRICCNEKL